MTCISFADSFCWGRDFRRSRWYSTEVRDFLSFCCGAYKAFQTEDLRCCPKWSNSAQCLCSPCISHFVWIYSIQCGRSVLCLSSPIRILAWSPPKPYIDLLALLSVLRWRSWLHRIWSILRYYSLWFWRFGQDFAFIFPCWIARHEVMRLCWRVIVVWW